jgi:L-ascorbate metabolism protein UlaG (beta-lactamase superfamily)
MNRFQGIILTCVFCNATCVSAVEIIHFENPQITTNRDLTLRVVAAASPFVRLERSHDLGQWEPVVTQKTTVTNEYSDTGAGYREVTYYRAVEISAADTWIGDHFSTSEGTLTIRPINHASFVINWNGRTIYNDPVGAATAYSGIPRADVILVSHEHGDHFSSSTLNAVRRTDATNTVIIASRAVYNGLNSTLRALTTVLTNGASTNVLGMAVEAVPAYNQNHPRGAGNGYVLTLGAKRLYMSGDTGAVAEMKDLENIDVAFVCMNLPFTMSVSQASGIVRDFTPRVVYPYHYRNQDGTRADLNLFRRQIGTDLGIEVRARNWY